MAVSKSVIRKLSPYLEADGPNKQGEWGMKCPLHDDQKRSASLNVELGVWYCQACEIGGPVKELVKRLPDAVHQGRAGVTVTETNRSRPGVEITESQVSRWVDDLFKKETILHEFIGRRGINEESILRWQIGWDQGQYAYTIPIRDERGYICNIRRYQLDPKEDRRKIWSVAGMGTPVLYPYEMLDHEELVLCEGELDAILTIQNGFAAITRTGAADVWKPNWSQKFAGKVVHVCHDMDPKGQKANDKISRALKDYARHVDVVHLPYDINEKHGKDLTDFWQDGYTPLDLFNMFTPELPTSVDEPEEVSLESISVLDSFSSENANKELKMRVTITGKRNPTYMIPRSVDFSCSQDAGVKCNFCPMNELNGVAQKDIDPRDPRVLEMMGATNKQVEEILRNVVNAQKCGMLVSEITEFQSVEELYVRPSIESTPNADGGAYTNRKIIGVGRHDTLPNNTVEVVGSVYPNPRGQQNEFQAWELHKTETSIDKFEVTPEAVRRLKKFQVKAKQTPLDKAEEIAHDLSVHVTKIYGRPELHMMMDFVFHSILQFEFGGVLQQRGWLEALVVGDTRTGKSEAASKLISHYGAGEMISCESATFAGIVGGLQQYGGGKEWEITWGAIPLNDRRLVALDEVSGLSTDQISQMSSIRSSGEAQLTKIRSERTWARTRLIWLGNPRAGRLSDYTYGVHAILPLIGNNEDVARFDLAMSVSTEDVDSREINKTHIEKSDQVYTKQDCETLLLWAWSRRADAVQWAAGATDAVYDAAMDMGKRYVESPPLVQSANVRIKIARLAVAIAARTFSTDETYEKVVVKIEHVKAAVQFLDRVYGMDGFGYKAHSSEALNDIATASKNYDKAKSYLVSNPHLAKFLRSSHGHFRRQDMEDMMNMSREEAVSIINTLWTMRMVERRMADVKIGPLLHQILREVAD